MSINLGFGDKIKKIKQEGCVHVFAVNVDAGALEAASQEALVRLQSVVSLPGFRVGKVPLATAADVVEALCASLPACSPTSFRELTAAACSRMEVVVHFLGLLELYKQGLVDLEQVATFGYALSEMLGSSPTSWTCVFRSRTGKPAPSASCSAMARTV